jgi:hypothetical protein
LGCASAWQPHPARAGPVARPRPAGAGDGRGDGPAHFVSRAPLHARTAGRRYCRPLSTRDARTMWAEPDDGCRHAARQGWSQHASPRLRVAGPNPRPGGRGQLALTCGPCQLKALLERTATADHRRARLPADTQRSRLTPLPGHQPPLRARLNRAHHQPRDRRLGRHLRRHHRRRRDPRPAPASRDRDAHQGNATLNYRSVLVRELTVEDAEIYRRSGHRRRSRRESVGGKRPENV